MVTNTALRSPEGFAATANYFVMDWAAIWRDIVGGLLIAGALAAWGPTRSGNGCSSNTTRRDEVLGADHRATSRRRELRLLDRKRPLGRVLRSRGISFGGVLAFIFADLIILPILDIYRRFYGLKMAALRRHRRPTNAKDDEHDA